MTAGFWPNVIIIQDRSLGLRRWKNSVLFLTLTGCAALLGYSEIRAANLRDGASLWAERLGELDTQLPYSLTGIDAALAVCLRATSGNDRLFQPKSQRQETALICGNLAGQVLDRMPSHGTAFLVAAQSAGRPENRAYFLEQSQRFAPSEGWLAERRIVLALQEDALDSRYAQKDLQLVLTTQGGAEFLAKLYLAQPETRDGLTAAVLSTPEPIRRRFVNQLSKQKAAR